MAAPIRHEQLAPRGNTHRIFWTCSNCGGDIGRDDAYCRHCGKKLTKK